jgi:hypothetical protein
MRNSLFLLIARIEHSLREHHALWFFGVGTGMTAGVLFLLVMWQPTAAPFAYLLAPNAAPAAIGFSLARLQEESVREEEVQHIHTTSEPQEANEGADTPPVDVLLPEVALIGEARMSVPVGSAYTDEGAYAEGVDGERLPLRIFINEQRAEEVMLDTSLPARHLIRYEYKDTAGRTSSVTREVQVF